MSKANKPYTYLELAYKGEDGQVKGKKVMPFGESKVVFDTLSQAESGELFNVTAVKNNVSGFWDWTAASKSDGAAQAATAVSAARPVSGRVTSPDYETAEERARKQVYIVRQSSITAALSLVSMQGRKTGVTPKDITDVAKEFETFVFSTGEIDKPSVVDTLDTMEDDIPL